MKTIRILILTVAPLLGTAAALQAADDMTTMPGHEHSGHVSALTGTQRQFLSDYEAIRAALAVDDLTAAKAAAARLHGEQAAVQLAKADSLNSARIAFKKLSNQAVALVKGQTGFYIAHCTMVGSSWVQTTAKIDNPYLGAIMPSCGMIRN
jgi:hypothetical protein